MHILVAKCYKIRLLSLVATKLIQKTAKGNFCAAKFEYTLPLLHRDLNMIQLHMIIYTQPSFIIVVKQGQTDAVRRKPCGALCHCLKQIRSDMKETLNHFSSLENPPEDIAVALFECFEAMQSFNYESELCCTVHHTGQMHLGACPPHLDKP